MNDLRVPVLIAVPATGSLHRRRSAQRTLQTAIWGRVRCADRSPLAGTTIKAESHAGGTRISGLQWLDAKLAKARSLKEGMMQDLLTGRIRLV